MNKRNIVSYFISSGNKEKRLKVDEQKTHENNEKDETAPTRKKVTPGTFLKWKKQFIWLEMKENDVMICNICREFAKPEDSSFVKGCPAFRFETVKIHDTSVVHSNACKAKCAKISPSEAPLAVVIKSMNAEVLSNMERLFNTAYLIAKEDYAFDDFKSLCALQKKNGLKLGETYINDKAAKLFVKYIADSMRLELKNQLLEANFFSLLADSSTDRSTIVSEIIYVSYLHKGEPKCSYLSLRESDDQTASGIKSTIVSALEEFVPGWNKKLVAVSFDGANVNMGDISGVAKQLQNECDGLISVHCVAHRLELAMSDALKNIKYVTAVEDVLKGVYSYYHNSPKHTKELKAVGDILDEKILLPVGLHGIRWLQSRHRAVKVMLNNLAAVVIHMEQVVSSEPDKKNSAKLKCYLKFLRSERFIRFLSLFQDVTNMLAFLSEVFQKKYVTLREICIGLESTKGKLKKMISENGAALKQFENELIIENSETVYKGIKITRNITDLSTFEEERRRLLQNIIESLERRYNSIKTDKVLGNLSIFDPCNLVNLGENENLKVNEQFKEIVEALPQKICNDKEKAMEQFEDFKIWAKDKIHIPCQSVWQRFMAETSLPFNNLKNIVHLAMILPLSTAECERGFSHLNLIKTPKRLCLSLSTVDDLLFIRLYGPDITDFNPQPAINLWWKDVAAGRVRRPDFKN